MTDQHDYESLRRELTGLFNYMSRVRQEIAAISRPADEEYQFGSMAEQLDAIVRATESASNRIMASVELNDELLSQLRNALTDPKQRALIDKILENSAEIFEACAFQDITGQRVNKVVRSIKYVEERVSALIDVWGKSELAKVDVKPKKEKSADEKLLHGPQLEGKGLDQSAIDALFS